MKKKRINKTIRGSGGGGDNNSSPSPPTIAPDSLASTAIMRVVDLIAEGEIVGLVNGNSSIFLDKTPLSESDGTLNFQGITVDTRNGTQDQTYIQGFDDVENETEVGVQLFNIGSGGLDGAIIRQVTNPDVDRIRIKITLPSLQSTDSSTGNVSGTSVVVRVDIQPNGGSYSTASEQTISGKASSQYEFTMEFPVIGDAPWNIRVIRETADTTNQYLQNQTYFTSYTEIIDAKLSYPNSAIVALRLDATYFQSVPSRYYEVDLLKIQIPSNYDDVTRTYTGVWDGTFKLSTGACNNPAWVFYDLCTNARFGLGAFVPPSQVDKWALYQIAQYCDSVDESGNYVGVPDGFGGIEPRFTCNLVLANAGDAYTVMQSLASVFRGMIYWAAGTVTVSQDSPQDPAYLFTPANVLDGRFTYQGASQKTMHSVALVTWNDPDNFYQPAVEYVEDQAAILKFGVQEAQVTAFGCTSRGQAHRFGQWLLYTEQHESQTVTFKTGLDAIVSRPGQVIRVADPGKSGARMGGRISSATTSTVTIDQDIVGAISGNMLSVLMPDGSVQESTVVGSSGRTIQVQPEYTETPNCQSIWILKSAEIEPQLFRVIDVQEQGGSIFQITAIFNDPDKYAFIEQGISLTPKSYSNLRVLPDSPSNVQISESLYQSGTDVITKITVSWDAASGAVAYALQYKKDDDNFTLLPQTSVRDLDILNVQPGNYTVQVCSINVIGKKSLPTKITKQILGKTAPPADVVGFSMVPNAGQAYLTWNQATDLDVLVGGQVVIRFTPNLTGQSWNDAIEIVPAVPGTATSALAPLLTGTYMIKFVDSSGNSSVNADEVITTAPYTSSLNIVQTLTEDPTFSGTKTSMVIDSSSLADPALVLGSDILVDSYGLVDGLISWDFPGGIAPSGTYDFAETVDLGGVWPTSIKSNIIVQAFDIAGVWDERLDPMDEWTDIDGDAIDDVNATLYVRTTNDDPGGTPTWTDWMRIAAGDVNARGFQFQLEATNGNSNHNIFIKNLAVTLDMDDRVINYGPLTSGTGSSYRVDYLDGDFFAVPAIGITANNMSSGDYYTITSDDATGFNIVFKNSAGTIVSRQFYVIAKGYGRKVA